MPSGYPVEWTPEMDALLGTMPSREVADELGVGIKAAQNRRRKLGILSWAEQNRVLPEGMSIFDPEANRIYIARRKHREAGLDNTLTYAQWLFACEWFNNCCAYCGQEAFLTEDHLVPLSKGGPRTALNILPACWPCNNSKRAQRAHLWIYEHFGVKQGREIVDRIVKYLVEVSSIVSGGVK